MTAEPIYPNVLIVTADSQATRTVLATLAGMAVRGDTAGTREAASRKWAQGPWDLALADLDTLGNGAKDFLARVRADAPEMPVIALGPGGDAAAAVRAFHAGCRDYLAKPLDASSLRERLAPLLPNHQVPLAASAQQEAHCLYRIAGRNPRFLEALALARKVAPTSIPVLISGESGTGKELVSYLIHRESRRRPNPYVRVNCASLSESLLESELFGHERGAFTGAYARRKGRFERAHGGTLLLDEISETGARLQAELLRVLEQQDFERVGGSESIRVNVRVISTSNRDLNVEVRRGRFRRDLFYRLSGVHIVVPPLRERSDDLAVLTWHFVNLYAREVHRQITHLDESMLQAFRRCRWPGNVRQLRNAVRAALVLGEGPVLSLRDAPAVHEALEAADASAPPAGTTLQLHQIERQAIFEALRRTQSHQAKAARLLGITDRTLREKLRRYRQDENDDESDLQVAGETQWLTESR